MPLYSLRGLDGFVPDRDTLGRIMARGRGSRADRSAGRATSPGLAPPPPTVEAAPITSPVRTVRASDSTLQPATSVRVPDYGIRPSSTLAPGGGSAPAPSLRPSSPGLRPGGDRALPGRSASPAPRPSGGAASSPYAPPAASSSSSSTQVHMPEGGSAPVTTIVMQQPAPSGGLPTWAWVAIAGGAAVAGALIVRGLR